MASTGHDAGQVFQENGKEGVKGNTEFRVLQSKNIKYFRGSSL